MTAKTARDALTDHPYYRYRGCAPDPDQPTRAAANPDVALDAWLPYTGDGAEPQKERFARERAAIDICRRCPVLAACHAYANTELVEVGEDGQETVRLAEPEGVMGGMRALDRHRALIARRTGTHPVTDRSLAEARSPQKQTVLAALAVELYESRVARRAGMDVRTTNWHRSALCGLLGLDKETATRDQLLLAALEYGVLPDVPRIVWDGLWPIAAAPTTDGTRQRRIAPDQPLELLTPRPARARAGRSRTGGTRRPPRRKAAPDGTLRGLRLRVVPTPAAPALLPAPALEAAA